MEEKTDNTMAGFRITVLADTKQRLVLGQDASFGMLHKHGAKRSAPCVSFRGMQLEQ